MEGVVWYICMSIQEKVAKAKEEGNEFYRKDKYNEALAKYYQALPLCQQHKLEEEEALIRGNCAQVCLQLKLFKDAYEHANECLRLDPESSKVWLKFSTCILKIWVLIIDVEFALFLSLTSTGLLPQGRSS